MLQTVGDVIEFWNAYCDRERIEDRDRDSQAIRDFGADRIADDPEYWGREDMSKLLDQARAAA